MDAAVGFGASLQPRVIKHKRRKVFQLVLPGVGRIGFTRDPGDAGLFRSVTFETRLGAIVRDQAGRLLEERDLGSGLVTNVGVLCLAADYGCPGVATNAASLFANLKWHAWGTGSTAAATTDIKLQTPAAPTATSAQAAATNALSAVGTGEPKFVSTSKIVAGGTLAITEWGIFTGTTLSATTGTPLTAKTATSGTVTGTGLTASSASAVGETLKIVVPTESEECWGLVTSNTTSVVTVPAWYKQSSGAVKEPATTSPFSIKPVMFDHRVFSALNVELANTIEFPWELTIKSGG